MALKPNFDFTSALMKSLDSMPTTEEPRSLNSLPDVTLTSELTSLKLRLANDPSSGIGSFMLLNENEELKVSSAEKFTVNLGCADPSIRVKVVAIVGNTGDGKSHTLNQVFFQGEPVFSTSTDQTSCTMGVWAAFDPCLNVIVLDTEGLLGTTNQDKQRMRLLLKVLAVSDIIIYRTRSERLHSDMYTFLGSASRAFSQHFQSALSTINSRGGFVGTLSALGPAVIIFHETHNTKPLISTSTQSAEDSLRSRFQELNLEIDAFSCIRYLGIRTSRPPTKFSSLRDLLVAELQNTSIRSARQPTVVFQALKLLNDKFNGKIKEPPRTLFPDEYFTCGLKCLSCGQRCEASMGHTKDGQPHVSKGRCCYQHQFCNKLYICRACHANGREVVVTESDESWLGLAKHAWGGYTINCPHCGEIYRSRQYWYGNKSPEEVAVRTEITHVWPGSNQLMGGPQNTAQRVLDGVTFISEAVASVSSEPTRVLSSWVTDQIKPKYWRPDNEIKNCHACKRPFETAETKHHCRACGEGFCDKCSSKSRPVPERDWLTDVRVCDKCYLGGEKKAPAPAVTPTDGADVRARKYGEAVFSTLSSVAAVFEYPKGLIKDSARPSYWVPDQDATKCAICEREFTPLLLLHHCRDCGNAVCDPCSSHRRPVPNRGWNSPVRVCKKCLIKE